MGKGICADSLVGDRDAQAKWRETFGGSGEYPWEIQLRLDALEPTQKKSPATDADRKEINYE